MTGFWLLLVWNAVLATGLAIGVALVGCLKAVRYRPGLRHTLWLLVLLKLITPPVIPLPVLPSRLIVSNVIISTGVLLPVSGPQQPLTDSQQGRIAPAADDSKVLAPPEVATSSAHAKTVPTLRADCLPWLVLFVATTLAP